MRDGQQSLFATRMSQATIDRLLPLYENAGFYIMEVWGGAVPDSVMRYLDESPWTRLRKASEAMKGNHYCQHCRVDVIFSDMCPTQTAFLKVSTRKLLRMV